MKTFTEKEADRARAAKIATLPREVAEAVRAMSQDNQDQYLASLDRVEELQAAGKTIPAPKKRPGRKPAQAAGARTAAKMELVPHEIDWSAVDDCPDDDEPVNFGYGAYEGMFDEAGKPIVPTDTAPAAPVETTEQREHRERLEAEAELAAKLEAMGIRHATKGVAAGPFKAVQLVEVGDPEVDLASYRVDRIECEVRIVDRRRDYHLEIKFGDGDWQPEGGGMIDPTSAGVVLARKKIRPVDSDAFGVALNALPKPHPAVAHLYDRRAVDARQLTADERRKHSEEIKTAMIEQRQSNALHRGNYTDRADRTGEGYSWI